MRIDIALAILRFELLLVFFGSFAINVLAKLVGSYDLLNLIYELALILVPFLYIFAGKRVHIVVALVYAAISLCLCHLAYVGYVTGSFASSIFSGFIPFKFCGLLLLSSYFQQDRLISEFKNILNIVLVVTIVAVGLQLLGVASFLEFSRPYQVDGQGYKIYQDIASWDNSAWGLFDNQISLALFGLCALVFYNYFDENYHYRVLRATACLILIASSISLMAMLLAGIFYISRIKFLWVRYVFFLIIPLTIPILVPIYFAGLDFSAFLEIARMSRLGILIDILPAFLFEANISDLFFGLGHSVQAATFILSIDNYPAIFDMSSDLAPLEDVYWVALLLYFGIFGTLGYTLTLSVGLIFYKQVNSRYFVFYFMLLLFVFVGNFANQVLSISSFAIVFWFSLTLLLGEVRNRKML